MPSAARAWHTTLSAFIQEKDARPLFLKRICGRWPLTDTAYYSAHTSTISSSHAFCSFLASMCMCYFPPFSSLSLQYVSLTRKSGEFSNQSYETWYYQVHFYCKEWCNHQFRLNEFMTITMSSCFFSRCNSTYSYTYFCTHLIFPPHTLT